MQYTLSFKAYVSAGSASFRIKYDDDTYTNVIIDSTTEKDYIQITTAGKNVVGLYGTYVSGSGNTLYIKDILFEIVSIVAPYIPYGCIGLSRCGKNEFDKNNLSKYGFSGTVEDEGAIIWNLGSDFTHSLRITNFKENTQYSIIYEAKKIVQVLLKLLLQEYIILMEQIVILGLIIYQLHIKQKNTQQQ